jgi:hypothetical protein
VTQRGDRTGYCLRAKVLGKDQGVLGIGDAQRAAALVTGIRRDKNQGKAMRERVTSGKAGIEWKERIHSRGLGDESRSKDHAEYRRRAPFLLPRFGSRKMTA